MIRKNLIIFYFLYFIYILFMLLNKNRQIKKKLLFYVGIASERA
jgi:hypothetical protein